jgi:putative endopeptidase
MSLKSLAGAAAVAALMLAAQPALAQDIQPWGFDLDGRDLSVRPGDDFNAFANGAYLRNTPIPADKTSYGVFDLLYDRSQDQLRAIIEQSAANPAASADAGRIGALYGSFMDEARVASLGAAPLAQDLAAIRAADTREEIARLMGSTQGGFGGSLFGLAVFEDFLDNTKYSAFVFQGGLGLPDRDYYLTDQFATQKTAYRAYVEQMLRLIGWEDPAGSADAILAFETAVAGKHWTQVESRQFDRLYNPTTLAALAESAPGFPWAAWAEGVGVAGIGQVIAANNTAFPEMARVFAETPVATLQAWQAFHTADQAAPYLSPEFVQARFDFRGKVLSGQQEMLPRWKRGVQLVDGQIGESLGREYVSRHFSPEAKAEMERLVGNLRAAMTERLQTLEWMSDATREQALYKMSRFGVKVGYPEIWRDYDGLTLEPGDLYGNVERASAFNWAHELEKLQTGVDPREWGMTPQTVNAYYNPPRNEIVFPAAILQAPFFDLNADPAVNYGAIGGVIGHEITHGFDDQGRKFDGDGRLRDWWTAEDGAAFEARAAVLGAQYSGLSPLDGATVNGDLTMGENIADLGGLLLALDAYHRSLNGAPAPVLNGLTGEQRVFLGWAQVWRENIREEALRQQIATDPHSPARYRASQPARNIDAWYAAFGVTPDDAAFIAPDARARIW